MGKQRSNYTSDELKVFEKRAKEFIERKPNASRAKISIYSGVGISVLERLEKNGAFKLPKPMTSKQIRKTNKDWTSF